VSTVKTSTYAFGLLGGALVGLLIALQITLVDKRVRSLSQLTNRFESQSLLGTVTHEVSSVQHTAAAVVARARALSLLSVALVPVDDKTDAQTLAERIHTVTSPLGVSVSSLPNMEKVSANEMISSDSGVIALATRGISTTDDIVATWLVMEQAQKPILGVLLTDSAI